MLVFDRTWLGTRWPPSCGILAPLNGVTESRTPLEISATSPLRQDRTGAPCAHSRSVEGQSTAVNISRQSFSCSFLSAHQPDRKVFLMSSHSPSCSRSAGPWQLRPMRETHCEFGRLMAVQRPRSSHPHLSLRQGDSLHDHARHRLSCL